MTYEDWYVKLERRVESTEKNVAEHEQQIGKLEKWKWECEALNEVFGPREEQCLCENDKTRSVCGVPCPIHNTPTPPEQEGAGWWWCRWCGHYWNAGPRFNKSLGRVLPGQSTNPGVHAYKGNSAATCDGSSIVRVVPAPPPGMRYVAVEENAFTFKYHSEGCDLPNACADDCCHVIALPERKP